MSSFDLGDVVPLGITTFNDASGDPEDAASVTLAITKPDGTAVTPAPTLTHVTGSGVWTYNYPTTAAGRHRYAFTVTGTATVSGGVDTGTFDVWPADPRFIVDPSEIREELSVRTGSTVDDDELRLYCAAATALVEEIAGTVLSATLVETHDGGKRAVLLDERPTAITSVVVNGVAATDYVADLASGIVYAGSQSSPSTFSSGRQNVVVTYTAGSSTVDANVVLAARIIIAHLYQVGQQGRRGRNSNDDVAVLSSGFAVPRRAVELLRNRAAYRMPGIA